MNTHPTPRWPVGVSLALMVISFCLSALAAEAARLGGTAPAVLNAANEIAVAAFLDRRIGYPAIPAIIEGALAAVPPVAVNALEEVLAADGEARARAEELLVAHAVRS